MKIRPILLTSLTIALSAILCQGQTVGLDSCRRMAVRNNKSIRVADSGIEAARYRSKAAKAAYLPGFDLTASYTWNQRIINLLGEDAKLPTMSFDPKTMGYNYNILTGPDGKPITDPKSGSVIPTEVAVIPKEAMSYDIHNVFAGAVTVTQPVYMGGTIRAMNEITKYAEQMAITARNAAVQEIIYEVDEAYWLVVSLKAKQKLAQSFVELVDTLKYNVDCMLKEGVATRSDVLTVDVKRNEAEIALVKVNNGLSLARMALAQICGLPVDTQMTLADEDGEKVAVYPETMLADYNMEQVYTDRQDLATLRNAISVFEHKEKLALGSMLPKIALYGAYSVTNPNVIDGFEKRFGGGFSFGAMVTIPLWHWGGNYNNYRAAKAETQGQRLLLDDLEEKVQLQVSQARYKYQEAYKTYTMTQANRVKAAENLRQAQLGFREGVMTTSDVIAAQTAWLQANSENIDAEIGIQLCNAYLSKVLGKI